MNRLNAHAKRWIAASLAVALVAAGVQMPNLLAKSKIKLNKKKLTLNVGSKKKLKVKGTKKKVKWKSKKKKIATVSKKGVVKAKKVGKTKVIAKVAGKKLICKVTVKAKKDGNTGTDPSTIVNASTAPTGTASADTSAAPTGSAASDASAAPAESTSATTSAAPEGSASSDESAAPDESANPDESVAPDESASPNESVSPDESTNPDESASPDESTNPDESANPEANETKEPVVSEEPGQSPEVTSPTDATETPAAVETEEPGEEFPRYVGEAYVEGTPDTPTLSKGTGAYEDGFTLYLASQEGTELYYTTDGSLPTTDSTKYDGKGIQIKDMNGTANSLSSAENIKKMLIPNSGYDYTPTADQVAKATVIRVIAVAPDGTTSEVTTNTFFVNNDLANRYPNVNIVSLVIDPTDLLDYNTGILALGKLYDDWKSSTESSYVVNSRQYWNYVGNYTQSGSDWERPVTIEYLNGSDGSVLFSEKAGVRIHGGASRMYGQKSFRIYFSDKYGNKNLKYPLIPGDVDQDGKQIKKYKRFIIRNGGNDCEYTKIRDVFNQRRLKNRNFATQASTPCVMFLNGEYWGVYNITERYNDNDIENNFGVDKDNVVAFKENELDEGTTDDQALFDELMAFANKDFTDDSVYEDFCSKMDIESFTDYYAAEIYLSNNDWSPKKNYYLWRTRTTDETNPYADGKWRYLIYDTDQTMGLYGSGDRYNTDSLARTITNDSLFAAVIKNDSFKAKFKERLLDIADNDFNPDPDGEAIQELEELRALYKPLMNEFYDRFGITWKPFDDKINTMIEFMQKRRNFLVEYCEDNLGI